MGITFTCHSVWLREITTLDDPDIHEVAKGGDLSLPHVEEDQVDILITRYVRPQQARHARFWRGVVGLRHVCHDRAHQVGEAATCIVWNLEGSLLNRERHYLPITIEAYTGYFEQANALPARVEQLGPMILLEWRVIDIDIQKTQGNGISIDGERWHGYPLVQLAQDAIHIERAGRDDQIVPIGGKLNGKATFSY